MIAKVAQVMVLGAISLGLLATAEFPKPGEWPSYRRGGGLMARSPGHGVLRNPVFKELQFVGARDNVLMVEEGSATTHTLALTQVPRSTEAISNPRWGLNPPIPSDQSLIPFAGGEDDVYAHVLPDEPALQWIQCENGFNLPTTKGQWPSARVRCKKWSGGAWQIAWETEPFDMLFSSNVLAGDFDNDGASEIAILPWHQLVILDGRTGALKQQCRFTDGRSYGYLSVYDLDADGRKEFVVLADFCKHIDVLGYDPAGKLVLKWRREIELEFDNPRRQMRVNPYCVADLNGDGKLEIAVSLHNPPATAGTALKDDNQWHVVVYDGISGAVLADYLNETLSGIVDLDGNGTSELLTQSSALQNRNNYGMLRVHSLTTGVLWSMPNAAWEMYDPALKSTLDHEVLASDRVASGSNGVPQAFWKREASGWVRWDPGFNQVHSGATQAHVNILFRKLADNAAVVIRRLSSLNADEVNLSLAIWGTKGFTLGRSVTGRHLRGLAIADNGDLLVRETSSDPAASISLCGATAGHLFTQPRGVTVHGNSTVTVAWDDKATQPIILATGADDEQEIVAFRPPAEKGAKGQELWRQPGRVQSDNWPTNYGPVLADLDNDGRRELIYATAAPDTGCGRLTVCRLADHKEVWHHDFQDIPGEAPIWNTGGITLWKVGNFRSTSTLDVLVTVRRNIMHSDQTYLLDGSDGQKVWHRVSAGSSASLLRGAGGQPFALADFNGDGLDDPASFYPDLFYILNGATGANLIVTTVASLAGHPAEDTGGYWGVPLAGDFMNNGAPVLFHGTTRASLTGVVVPDVAHNSGRFAWATAIGVSPISLPAFGDIDEDRKLEAVCVGFQDGIRCYDTETGKQKWRLPSPGTPNGAAAADLDGNGMDEAIFTVGASLYCYGNGELKWSLLLPASLGAPTLADIDGTGRLSILTPGADGMIYSVHEKALP